MTLEKSALAIDGATISSALLRRGLQISASGGEGVGRASDLKVTQLSTPGVGVQIAPGVAVVLNRYQADPNESYVVSNPTPHIIPSAQMPASNPAAKSYILALVVGDPEFSQTGHPWMLASDPPAGEEETFEYVRATLIEVPSGSTTIPGATYPYYALARIAIPANTTTITNSMITDLRRLANPRNYQRMFVSPAGTYTNGSPRYIHAGTQYANFSGDSGGGFFPSIAVPSWAKRAVVSGRLNGVTLTNAHVSTAGKLRFQLGQMFGAVTDWNTANISGPVRLNLEAAGEFDVSAHAGTVQTLLIEGYQTDPAGATLAQRARLDAGSQVIIDVRFFEE
jgi:hypothetical protein